jgi:hypothetical protein
MVPCLMALAVTPGVELRMSVDGGKPASGWVYARAGQRIVLEAASWPLRGAHPAAVEEGT